MTTPFKNFTNPTTDTGRNLWGIATKELKDEFSGAKSGYPVFKSQLRDRIKLCGWEDIITYTVNGNNFNLIDNADLIPMNSVLSKKNRTEEIILNGVRTARAADPVAGVEPLTAITADQFNKAKLQ